MIEDRELNPVLHQKKGILETCWLMLMKNNYYVLNQFSSSVTSEDKIHFLYISELDLILYFYSTSPVLLLCPLSKPGWLPRIDYSRLSYSLSVFYKLFSVSG